MSHITKILGERIRIYRLKSELSQEALAEKAGLHPTYIGQIERGEKNATIESIEKIVLALDISFETLFENIISNNKNVNTTAINCYNLILSQNGNIQNELLEIISRIINITK